MLMALFYVHKIVKIHHRKKHSFTPLIFILKFSKKLDKVYNDFKDWTKRFSNKFIVGFVYVFEVGVIKINFNFLFIRSNFIFHSNVWS